MTVDVDLVAEGLRQAVPFVRTLNLEFLQVGTTRARLRLPDQPAVHNHVGGPHAGAMFTLGESAAGALVLANFSHTLDRATPLAVSAEIRYLRLARGAVTAEAVLGRSAAEVLAELDRGGRPEFDVPVMIRMDDDPGGAPTGEMVVRWTLRPNR
jgi:acyl-coenzyme A thioesterase PaaI-like protein